MSSLDVTVEEEQRETLKMFDFCFYLWFAAEGLHPLGNFRLTRAVAAACCNGGRKQRQLISFSCFIELASKPESNSG